MFPTRKMFTKIFGAAAVTTLLFSTAPAAAQAAVVTPKAATISAASFGMHTPNQMPTNIAHGSIRLLGGGAPSRDGENFYLGWADLEPTRGVYKWAALDTALNAATIWGYTDISYSVTRIPSYAADRSIGQVAQTKSAWGEPNLTASLPNLTMYTEFANALAQHLAQRPKVWPYFANTLSVEPMNEAGSAGWMRFGVPDVPGRKWSSAQMTITANRMGKMTAIMSAAMKKYSVPNMKVLAGSTVLGGTGRAWGVPGNSAGATDQARIIYWLKYLAYLKKHNVDFYAFALHHYSASAATRSQVMAWTDATISSADPSGRLGAKPKWDTEFNLGGNSDLSGGHYSDPAGAAELVKAYVLGFSQGYERQFWYKYSKFYDPFTGVQLGSVGEPDSAVKNTTSNANIAYNNLFSILAGATPAGCSVYSFAGNPNATGCKFSSAKYPKGFYVVWAKTNTVTGVSLAVQTKLWDVHPIVFNAGPSAVTNGAIYFGPQPVLVVAK